MHWAAAVSWPWPVIFVSPPTPLCSASRSAVWASCRKGRAKELIFTCDRIDAQEAYRIGLANKVVPKEELMAACETMARKILSKGSYAVTLAKACVESGMDMDIENGLRMEATTFGMSFATHDKAEGMRAFLEKRPAVFQNK